MGFVHLHVHSQFSLLDGTMHPEEIASRAAKHGMPAVALTDTANLYGAVGFYKACKKHGVRPIIGSELNVRFNDVEEGHRRRDEDFQVQALVENDQGYRNLCELVTLGIFEGMNYRPRVSVRDLEQRSEGLLFLTGGRKGIFGRSVRVGRVAEAKERFARLASFLSNEQLFLELQDLGLDGQQEINDVVKQLAAQEGYHLVVTNAVHYGAPDDSVVHEALNAISLGISLDNPERIICPTDQAWFKSEEEMKALFPNDLEAILRSGELAERCEFHFDFDTYHFPATTPPDTNESGQPQPDTDANWAYFYDAFPPPRDFVLSSDEAGKPIRPVGAGNLNGYFRWYSVEGLKSRLERVPPERHAEYHARLEEELGIIEGMGFPAYLLIVAEFINWSKDNGIPVGPGRGSAAGSLVAFAMRITDIDPLVYGLLFERFLNPERVSMPDIDVDFCQDRREEAIAHVRDKYGSELVSQIITYGTLKAKAAIRDVARILGLSFTESDRLSKLVPDELGITIEEALQKAPLLASLRDGDAKIRRVIDLAQRVEGMCRQTGIHAAGVVIADKPLVQYAPLYRDEPEGGPVVQYDMKSAESIGLIKFDFLGLKTLDQIRDALELIEKNHGIVLDMSDLPLDDSKTYQLLAKGDALGIFQLESSGMRELLTRLKPNCMDDMVALVALYRPGPLQSGMTDDFVERKHGRTKVEYPVPELEPVLRGTYGTVIYQEQVMKIAQIMASYSLGEADLLRRAMGKKIKAEMNKQRKRFVKGSIDNGFSSDKAEEIFEMMATFAAYGFNKSHSAAYGYISFQTAFLKAHYRPEYMAALMTVEAANTDKLLTYINDCRHHGIEILPVCVNESHREFYVPPPAARNGCDSIRFGLAAVKNVGSSAVEAIIEARTQRGGRFKDAFEVFEYMDYKRVNKRVLEHLIKAGAFDFDGTPRVALLADLGRAISAGTKLQMDRKSGQASLFGGLPTASAAIRYRFSEIAPEPLRLKLKAERDVLGIYLTGHPMQVHQEDVRRYARYSIRDLQSVEANQEVRLVGLPTEVQAIRTKRGDRMAFSQLEDKDSSVECVYFSKVWANSQRTVLAGEPVLVSGIVEVNDDGVKVKVQSVELLSDVRLRLTREVNLVFNSKELEGDGIDKLKRIFERFPGPCPVRMVVDIEDSCIVQLGLPEQSVNPGVGIEEELHRVFERSGIVRLR